MNLCLGRSHSPHHRGCASVYPLHHCYSSAAPVAGPLGGNSSRSTGSRVRPSCAHSLFPGNNHFRGKFPACARGCVLSHGSKSSHDSPGPDTGQRFPAALPAGIGLPENWLLPTLLGRILHPGLRVNSLGDIPSPGTCPR